MLIIAFASLFYPSLKLGSTALGIQTKDGVLLAVEKRITSPLMEPSSIEKIMEIESHVACAMSGLTADARTMIDHARVQAVDHWFTYNEPIRVASVTQAVCDLALKFGEGDDSDDEGSSGGTMSRPFGVALLIAGTDDLEGPVLYHTDPSGTFVRFSAKAIGSGSEGAQTALQDAYHSALTMAEAQTLALTVLKQVMEEKVNSTNVEMAIVTKKDGFRYMTKEELETIIESL